MAITTREQTPDTQAAEDRRTNVGIVDCDTHNYWQSIDELKPYLAKNWFELIETVGLRHFAGGEYPRFWGDPDDRVPPSARRPGSDPGFMATDHLDAKGIAYAMLIPLTAVTGMPDLAFAGALARAINDWQADIWLDADPRLRASIIVPTEDPVAAAAEVRRAGRDSRFVQVQFGGRPQEPMGRRRYWPIYEACAEVGIPVMSHAFGSTGNPITGTGWPSYYIEDHVDPPQAMQANVISMVFEGVFEQFPNLDFLSVVAGSGWEKPLMWRMDNAWRALPQEVPHLKRQPSEYMSEHVYYATQPVEEPPERDFFAHLFDQYPAFKDHLLFSSDYPHWDGDDPARALPGLHDADLRDRVLHQNGRRLYGLS